MRIELLQEALSSSSHLSITRRPPDRIEPSLSFETRQSKLCAKHNRAELNRRDCEKKTSRSAILLKKNKHAAVWRAVEKRKKSTAFGQEKTAVSRRHLSSSSENKKRKGVLKRDEAQTISKRKRAAFLHSTESHHSSLYRPTE